MGHRRLIIPVPVLSPRLSSWWLRLVTDVDLETARNLVDSMTNDVVVTDRRFEQLTGRRPMSFDDAVNLALADRAGQRRDGARA
jgi:predicted nucleic acid-binding protein